MNRVRPGLVLNQKLRGYNKVELTQHALSRMRQRNIAREDVFEAVEHPDLEDLPTTPDAAAGTLEQIRQLQHRCHIRRT